VVVHCFRDVRANKIKLNRGLPTIRNKITLIRSAPRLLRIVKVLNDRINNGDATVDFGTVMPDGGETLGEAVHAVISEVGAWTSENTVPSESA
jgi:hypothetical protein